MIKMYGHSALAERNGYLYVASRTSSHIVRVKLNADGTMVSPYEAELVAKFHPFDQTTGESSNVTDMDFDSKGRLYVVSAEPSRVFRFTPDPKNIYDATLPDAKPWCDLSVATDNPKMKSENVFVDDKDRVFVTSGDGYAYQKGALGTVYRIVIKN
jgi:sugar lactone lactonase YvrE